MPLDIEKWTSIREDSGDGFRARDGRGGVNVDKLPNGHDTVVER